MNALVLGAASAAVGVMAGAFGAHGLKSRVTPEALGVFEVGVRYQLVHALALVAAGLLARSGADTRLASQLFLWGTVLFSGSLYALALGGPKLLGPVTPLGGLLLIAGWIALAFAARG